MKKAVILYISVLLLAGCHQRRAVVITSGSARLVMEEDTFDFKEISDKTPPVSHTFRFTNAGSEPLVINKVSTNCACTTVGYTKQPVPSGDDGEITLTLDPSGTTYGHVVRSVDVYSNSKGSPTKIVLQANVVEDN